MNNYLIVVVVLVVLALVLSGCADQGWISTTVEYE